MSGNHTKGVMPGNGERLTVVPGTTGEAAMNAGSGNAAEPATYVIEKANRSSR
jgi:hypothetical protein